MTEEVGLIAKEVIDAGQNSPASRKSFFVSILATLITLTFIVIILYEPAERILKLIAQSKSF